MAINRPYKIEACVVNLEQALFVEARGADRVELCSKLEAEGMTPGIELVSTLVDRLRIPVRVMIRSTETGFEADPGVLDTMIESIKALKEIPLDGFVMGILKEHRIDRDAMELLFQHADPFPVTFHKAIDQSTDIVGDLEWLNQFPQVDTILTSGGAVKALGGIPELLRLKSLFNGNIMAGGKITPADLPVLHQELDLKWYHGRSIF